MSPSNESIDPAAETIQSGVVVAGTSITMQQLQQIYSELTGKEESISKYYDDPIHLSFDDIDQLHHRVTQTCEQYSIVSQGCSFTVYHIKNTKDTFNSFDRFKLQIAGGAEPVESVLLKYEFLVILPMLRKPQRYSISVRVVSRLALETRMREGPPFVSMPRFIKIMAQHTASVEITYVDYAVARTSLTAIDEWFQTIPRSPENKFMKFLQDWSHWIPRIAQIATAVIVVIVVGRILPHFEVSSFLQFSQFFLYSGLGMYAAYKFAWWTARYAETSVDRWSNVSYIKLNRGDDIEIANSKRENRNNLIKGAWGVLGTVVVNVVASMVAALASWYL